MAMSCLSVLLKDWCPSFMAKQLDNTKKDKQLGRLNKKLLTLSGTALYRYRLENKYLPVPGEGSSNARVMFIGEAPGEKEAQTGRPFVGASGKQLDKFLESIKLSREAVFITSVVKDRPPKNRDPLPEEIALYGPLLISQINIIQPTVVATLGRYSLQYLLHFYKSPLAGQTISALHGKPIEVNAPYGQLTILPLYHPAVVLYGQKLRQTLYDDFQVLKRLLRKKS